MINMKPIYSQCEKIHTLFMKNFIPCMQLSTSIILGYPTTLDPELNKTLLVNLEVMEVNWKTYLASQ